MSLRREIETWVAALEAYEAQDFVTAMNTFKQIAEQAKIVFNMAMIHATLAEHDDAIELFTKATKLDQYFAVAYFQRGVSNFLLGDFNEAITDFDNAHVYLRNNLTIDYEQLGLNFRLYSCEVLFNRGLALIYAGQEDQGSQDMMDARTQKQTAEHDVIDEAIQAGGEGYTVFSIPVGIVFRPAENKVKNLRTKNYLGQAKLIAATDAAETFVGFTGSERRDMRMNGMNGGMSGGFNGGMNAITPTPMVTSRGPAVDDIEFARPTGMGLARRGTAAARMEQSGMGPAAPDLRRRPTETTAAISTGLARNQNMGNMRGGAGMLGGPTPAARQMGRSPDRDYADDASRYGDSRAGGGSYADDIVDDYGFDDQDAGQGAAAPARRSDERVSDWTRNNNAGGAKPAFGGGRNNASPLTPRGFQRPPGVKNPSPSANSSYDGYAMSEFYGSEAGSMATGIPMTGIRVLLHVAGDTRGMLVDSQTSLDQFVAKVRKRFVIQSDQFAMKYKDDDGHRVTVLDEEDWESAVGTARAHARGRPEGKLEVWVEES